MTFSMAAFNGIGESTSVASSAMATTQPAMIAAGTPKNVTHSLAALPTSFCLFIVVSSYGNVDRTCPARFTAFAIENKERDPRDPQRSDVNQLPHDEAPPDADGHGDANVATRNC